MSSPLNSLEQVAAAIVADGRGILAADESTRTLKKRFDKIGVETTEENARRYRELLFTTDGAEKFVSAVILFDATIRQQAKDGTPFAELLNRRGILPGIKVDQGPRPLAFSGGEQITDGLDGLGARLAEYRKLGARFAKWRAVIAISDQGHPSDYCIHVNAHALARYAALCIEHDLVPIVEPEVLMDGAHTIDTCLAVTERTLAQVYLELRAQRVVLEKTLLKPNMVISAIDCPVQAASSEVAEKTLACLKRTVPAAVPGIVFLSGGQSEAMATKNLHAMNASGIARPWPLSFSYGRALQATALDAWRGKTENTSAAQAAYRNRARLNSAAALGKYNSAEEKH